MCCMMSLLGSKLFLPAGIDVTAMWHYKAVASPAAAISVMQHPSPQQSHAASHGMLKRQTAKPPCRLLMHLLCYSRHLSCSYQHISHRTEVKQLVCISVYTVCITNSVVCALQGASSPAALAGGQPLLPSMFFQLLGSFNPNNARPSTVTATGVCQLHHTCNVIITA